MRLQGRVHTETTEIGGLLRKKVKMPKRQYKRDAPDAKRKKNFSNAEVEVLLQEVTKKRSIIFSSVSSGCKVIQKKDAWNAITRAVNVVSGEERTADEVKKKWFDLKSETKRSIAKQRREMQTTGGGQTCPERSELDQRIGAIIGETALSGVPSAKHLDTDMGPVPESEELLQRQPPSEEETGTSQPVPSCSSQPASLRAPRSRSTALHHISDAVLDNQNRIAETLSHIASTLVTISMTLQEINTNLKK